MTKGPGTLPAGTLPADTMEWTEANAEALVRLRCLSAGGDWACFWGFDELSKHVHRLAI